MLKTSQELEILSAYTIEKEEALPDVNGLGVVLRHKKSGARVAVISNDDKNKVFCVSFRTPPENSTGVPHIIEHSVLCGSDKFPVKDPFIELAKGSLNTFLNAMTAPDRTMYPVASCNEQDFKNLMHVYMDAVFYPNIYKQEEIFKQEGWHYELESADAELVYNGIVYSEMKGAFSSPESVLARQIQNSLFPDTTYGVESGGDPDVIPELTYEQFLDFHRRYYHPSNSYIFLYGNMDMAERLRWIDEEYLQNFTEQPIDSAVAYQEPFGGTKESISYYSVNQESEEENATFLSYNVLTDASLNQEKSIAFDILSRVLLNAPGAPLKKALLDAGIGEEISGYHADGMLQPYFTVIAKNTSAEKKEQFVEIIEEVLAKCVKEGLNQNSLHAAINSQEFHYREADFGSFPKGVLYAIETMATWNYDETEPFLFRHGNRVYASLKEKIGTGYFEQLIQDNLLNSNHKTILTLAPKAGLNKEKEEKLKETLAAYKASLSEAEIDALVAQTKHLKEYQDAPSTKEGLLSIPLLKREDIEKKADPFVNEEKELDGVKVLHQPVYTNGIAYVTLLFDFKKCPERLLPYVGLLARMYGKVDTSLHAYLDLSNEIDIHTGGIGYGCTVYRHYKNSELYYPKFTITAKALYDKLPELVQFIREVLLDTQFTDTKRLQEIVLEEKSRLESYLNSAGNAVALRRATSYFDKASCIQQRLGDDLDFYAFIAELANNFETKKEELAASLVETAKYVFGKDNLLVSVTADETGFEAFKNSIGNLLAVLPEHVQKAEELSLTPVKKQEGYMTAGQVQYVALAGNFKKAGFAYNGAFTILNNMLSYGYLWNNVRVKGGAYGASCGFAANGNVYFASYRDPNLASTYETYAQTAEYLRQFEADEREMTKYIIGTMSHVDMPRTPQMEGRRGLIAYLTGMEFADVQKERDEILAAEVEDIRATADAVDAVLKQNYICVLGTEKALRENEEKFESIQNLMQ